MIAVPRRWPQHPTGARSRGQGLVEFALILPLFLLLLLGILEFAFLFDHTITLSYSTREGARTGAALANGGGPLGCGAGQSPNAATVDPQIVGAVQRVLTSPGSQIALARIDEIRLFKATTIGQPEGGLQNVWTYSPGSGPVVDGQRLDFVQTSVGWQACARSNGATPDSIGVSLRYRYEFATPLRSILGLFGPPGNGSLSVSDRTVMALNPS